MVYTVISEGDLQLLSGGSFKADDTISLIAALNEGVIKGSQLPQLLQLPTKLNSALLPQVIVI